MSTHDLKTLFLGGPVTPPTLALALQVLIILVKLFETRLISFFSVSLADLPERIQRRRGLSQ